MNRHDFQQAARAFRAGRLSLNEFTEKVYGETAAGAPPAAATAVQLPARPAAAHKGTCGHVLVVGGSHATPGAAALAALSALRGGAGLVTVATVESARQTVLHLSPCLMTVTWDDAATAPAITSLPAFRRALERADVLALGPGLGQSESAQQLACWLYDTLRAPIVVDADALNVIAAAGLPWRQHAGPRILTPHPGEFLRMIARRAPPESKAHPTTRAEFEEVARQLAIDSQTVVVLKGAPSFVTDGAESFHNVTGNAGLATAGTGDVLTGLIAALIGQGLAPFAAAATGCALHGRAGELASHRDGLWSMIATDVIACLGAAFNELSQPA